MSLLIAVPIARIGCTVVIERARAWSAIDEVILLAIMQQARSMVELATLTDQPHQVIVASVARLMRFRLVEVELRDDGPALRASAFGVASVTGGHPLPVFPTRSGRRCSFVVEFATGDFFPSAQVQVMSLSKLRRQSQARVVTVEGGGPSLSQADNLARLTEIAARRWDEQVVGIDSRTATLRDDEFMVVRVLDGEPQGLPERAGPALRGLIAEIAAKPAGVNQVTVTYGGPKPPPLETIKTHDCDFAAEDLVIGAGAHRDLFAGLLGRAHRRMIIHSTFLDAKRFAALQDVLREACVRGVQFDLLWGDDDEDEATSRSAVAVGDIMAMVRDDPDMRDQFRVHHASTGSHAKILLLDTEDGDWIGVLGSCNWLSSPFNAVELSAVLRDQHVVADVCGALQRMAGRRGLADRLANEMGITANDLRREPARGGTTKVSLVAGAGHDELMRRASLEANRSLVVGCHRLGATARPGAILQSEAAATRGVASTVIFTFPSGPLNKRLARSLKEETAANGVRLVQVGKTLLHGKFLAWDDDDVVVSSLNWTSGSADPDHPWNDIGIHLHAPGLATRALTTLEAIFPTQLASRREPLDAGG
jgi:hypothetical protein